MRITTARNLVLEYLECDRPWEEMDRRKYSQIGAAVRKVIEHHPSLEYKGRKKPLYHICEFSSAKQFLEKRGKHISGAVSTSKTSDGLWAFYDEGRWGGDGQFLYKVKVEKDGIALDAHKFIKFSGEVSCEDRVISEKEVVVAPRSKADISMYPETIDVK